VQRTQVSRGWCRTPGGGGGRTVLVQLPVALFVDPRDPDPLAERPVAGDDQGEGQALLVVRHGAAAAAYDLPLGHVAVRGSADMEGAAGSRLTHSQVGDVGVLMGIATCSPHHVGNCATAAGFKVCRTVACMLHL